MNIYLNLFLTFLEIGVCSFGGGYGMISFIREKSLLNGWLTESELLNFLAVSESTPGPIAINMATFIGSSQGGVLGAFLATLGVVLPSFVIILIIAMFISNFLKFQGVKAVLSGIQPVVVGLILGTAITMFLSTVLSISSAQSVVMFDWQSLVIFSIVAIVSVVYKHFKGKNISAIILILIAAALGMGLYSIPC